MAAARKVRESAEKCARDFETRFYGDSLTGKRGRAGGPWRGEGEMGGGVIHRLKGGQMPNSQ